MLKMYQDIENIKFGFPMKKGGPPYLGQNSTNLHLEGINCRYTSSYWLTYKQVLNHGGHVIKSSKGTRIFFFKG